MDDVRTKTYPARVRVKADETDSEGGGSGAGQFEALVSVFNNRDSYGDIVRPGAFERTLSEWEEKGLPIPVYYSHRLDDPDMNLGHVLEAKETETGLWIRGQLDLDMPKAATVHRLFKGDRLSQFSFSYAVRDGSVQEDENGAEYYELRDLDLFEVGPTPVGANSETELLAVKDATAVARHLALRVKEGRVLSATNLDRLRSARDSLSDVITAAEATSSSDSGKASGAGSAKFEEPARAKNEEPDRSDPSAVPGAVDPSTSHARKTSHVLSELAIIDARRTRYDHYLTTAEGA